MIILTNAVSLGSLNNGGFTTLCLKTAPILKRHMLKIVRIDFDDIWQKYSKDTQSLHVSVFM